MKIIILTLAFFILIIFSGCTSNEANKNIEINEFPKKVLLKGQKVLDSGLYAVYVMDTFLVLRALRVSPKQNIFKTFNLNNEKYIGEFGIKGKGPNEFLAPNYSGQYFRDNDGVKFWVNDPFKKKLVLINLSKSIKQKKTIIEKNVKIQGRSVFYINKKLLVGRKDNLDGKLFIYNPVSQSIKYTSFVPEIKTMHDYTDIIYHDIYSIKPDKTKIISGMAYFNRLDIFNISGKLEKTIFIGKKQNSEDISRLFLKNKLMCYTEDIFTTNDKIFVLHSDQLDEETAEKEKEVSIQVFDWAGNPICILQIPEYILQFSIDKKNGVIYGSDYLNGNIWKYDIKDLINKKQ